MKNGKKFSVYTLVMIGLFVALEIVCERLIQIPIGSIGRYSVGKVVVIVGGLWFGPIAGAVIGAVSDLLGAILQGYGLGSPIITLSSMMWGIIPALFVPMMKNKSKVGKTVIMAVTIAVTCVISTLILTPIGLHTFYGLEYAAIMPTRYIQFCILSPLYIVCTVALYFSPLTKMVASLKK